MKMKRKDPFQYGAPIARCYAPELLELTKGKGSRVRDASGRWYLDFGAGIAVNALGYGRRDLARVAARQMRRLIHTSNLYTSPPTVALARTLTASGPFDACFFGNSGTEANEAALKLARLYASRTKGPGHARLVSFTNSFHGRTMGALSVTPTSAYREPFEPLVPETETLPFNDPEAVAQLDRRVAACIVEVIQGEGGLEQMTPEFVEALNSAREEHDIVLIVDEIQTGLGRTGSVYAHRTAGLKADIVTLAKPLAGGLPLSATLIPERINKLLSPGDHGSTFGGGPVTTAVAAHVWKTITPERFLEQVRARAVQLDGELDELAASRSELGRTLGAGLLRGVEVRCPENQAKTVIKEILGACRSRGLLILRSGANVLRLAPPLTVSKEDVSTAVRILGQALDAVEIPSPDGNDSAQGTAPAHAPGSPPTRSSGESSAPAGRPTSTGATTGAATGQSAAGQSTTEQSDQGDPS